MYQSKQQHSDMWVSAVQYSKDTYILIVTWDGGVTDACEIKLKEPVLDEED